MMTHLDGLLTSKSGTSWKNHRLLEYIIFLAHPKALCCTIVVLLVMVLRGKGTRELELHLTVKFLNVTLLQKQLQLNNLSDTLLGKHSLGDLNLICTKALFSAVVWIRNFKTWQEQF